MSNLLILIKDRVNMREILSWNAIGFGNHLHGEVILRDCTQFNYQVGQTTFFAINATWNGSLSYKQKGFHKSQKRIANRAPYIKCRYLVLDTIITT